MLEQVSNLKDVLMVTNQTSLPNQRMGYYHSVVSKHSWTFSNHIFTCPSNTPLLHYLLFSDDFASYTGLESPPRTPTDVHLHWHQHFSLLSEIQSSAFTVIFPIAHVISSISLVIPSLLVVLHQYTQKSFLSVHKSPGYGLNVCVPQNSYVDILTSSMAVQRWGLNGGN